MSCGWPDVQALQRQGRAVFVLDSGVYVLDEKFSHPGGAKASGLRTGIRGAAVRLTFGFDPQVLSANSGEDISALFGGQAGGHVHTAPARRLLERYWVGKLVDHRQQADDGADDTSNKGLSQTAASQFSIDESKPLLAQVRAGAAAARVAVAWLQRLMAAPPISRRPPAAGPVGAAASVPAAVRPAAVHAPASPPLTATSPGVVHTRRSGGLA